MRLLLDTHVLLWWLSDAPLDPTAAAAIIEPNNDVYVSAASAWEMSIKRTLGKLGAPYDLREQLLTNDFTALDITVGHAERAGALPSHHSDPFDRMLIAQAQALDLIVVTRDPRFGEYNVGLLSA